MAVTELEGGAGVEEVPRRLEVVDSDVHPVPRAPEELREYMPEPWRSRTTAVTNAGVYPSPHGHAMRVDAFAPSGGPPASDPEFTEKQLYESAQVTYAVLIPLAARPQVNPEQDLANCMAINDWLADTWLSKYNTRDIYRGTLRVPTADPGLAVREIERWAGDARFLQVMLDPGHQAPLGLGLFHPIYEACERHGLALAFHPIKGAGIRFLTPVGTPSYFLDYHSQLSHIMVSQLVSLVFGGVLDKYPTLRVACVEGGFGWLTPLLWRMDRAWERLGSETPWLTRRPSEIVRDRVRFTTQPFEEPAKPAHLRAVIDLVHNPEFFMFSSDYPHWDADDGSWIARHIPKDLRDGIMSKNALAFYGLADRTAPNA